MRALFLGSTPAAALGLLLGGMARPELAIEEPRRMEPVQVAFISTSYEPSPYAASAPSHVIGTGWARPSHDLYASSYVEPEPPPEDFSYAEHAYLEPRPTEPSAPEASFPSVDGDILAGTGTVEPPAIEAVSPEA